MDKQLYTNTIAKKIPCSVGILTYNSENRGLVKTLESVKDFAQIIICDGGSTDRTLEIARSYGCVILHDDPKYKDQDGHLLSYSGVRNQTLDAASYDWFFLIDSDEYIESEFIKEVSSIVENQKIPTAYWVPRKYIKDGVLINCATTYPNRQMRLFHRGCAKRFIKYIHEKIELKENANVDTMKNFMHVPLEDLESLKRKWAFSIIVELRTKPAMTVLDWVKSCLENLKISSLFAFRYVRNMIFCRGTRMPFQYELARHTYLFNMSKAFIALINKK